MQGWEMYDWSPHVGDVEIDGRRLRYAEFGEGPALLLLHGTGGSWTSWLMNLRELAEHHRVIAPDVPGFGGSEGPGPTDDLTPCADALATLLDHLEIERAAVAGHSLGGLVALGARRQRPPRRA